MTATPSALSGEENSVSYRATLGRNKSGHKRARDTGTALVLPHADAMRCRLEQISRCIADSAQTVVTLDKAGWHTTRKPQVRPKRQSRAARQPGAEPDREHLAVHV